QCMTDFCGVPKNVACGTCQPLPATGASCATLGCGRGLSCDATSMTCIQEGAMGAMCNRTTAPCGPDLSCVGSTMTTMGTWQPEGTAVGTACDNRAMTAPGCDGELGLFCNGMTKQCAAINYVAAGMPCGANAAMGIDNGCAGGGMCVTPTGAQMGSCVAP